MPAIFCVGIQLFLEKLLGPWLNCRAHFRIRVSHSNTDASSKKMWLYTATAIGNNSK